jgi:hypothetical protein
MSWELHLVSFYLRGCDPDKRSQWCLFQGKRILLQDDWSKDTPLPELFSPLVSLLYGSTLHSLVIVGSSFY